MILEFLRKYIMGINKQNKTLTLMKWATENVKFTYLMKCDDDIFVYVNNAITKLKRRLTTKQLYIVWHYTDQAYTRKLIIIDIAIHSKLRDLN